LLDCGIATRRGVMLAHKEPPYAEQPCPNALSVSEQASAHSMVIPLYPAMSDAEQQQVIQAFRVEAAAA
jgi:dTDP-4-amino-4,6-dideoxygalactose transaminase